ncbi:hypothetical protein FC26_GL001163 [Paucilactobacillus vaccinostercus DSM 20634]|uniref:Helix-turn-helix domain-containing protein n=1 Tax=Paucilactobacillus vaccinostercus DSM 20634 TaxID=1423813 RepID=A0A0R2A4E6_9LACO|nr:helix-turn-helix domain-containing protein [Paucilactobacillus vaccinostercus]KRM61888.1 hypothetical protein FC26_GL001163 [Paucilactobacillus vaccinostercus DSM 20634]
MKQIQIVLSDQQVEEIVNGTAQVIAEKMADDVDKYFGKKRYMNKQDACEYLGVSPSTISKWVAEGLREIRFGKNIRYDPVDLNEFMTAHKTEEFRM